LGPLRYSKSHTESVKLARRGLRLLPDVTNVPGHLFAQGVHEGVDLVAVISNTRATMHAV